ncbi:MAG: HAMP domain-containing histidine kinase [Alphaproteobacteria bacterium]|nr:HAMP domain-containing histidine kinase [Alphaproteobacteria bacterium]
MRPIRLLDTTAFRLTLIYLGLFGVSALALLGYLYLATAGFMTRQTTETIQAEIAGLAEQYRTQGLPRLRQVIEQRSAAQPHRASIYLLTDPSGRWVGGNIDRWPDAEPGEGGWLTFPVAVKPDGLRTENRRAVAQSFRLRGGYRLLVGREVEERLQLQTRIKHALSWGLGLTLLLGLAGGLLMSRGLLRRVDGINRTTEQIMAGDLSRRITLNRTRGDEFDQLAANLNAMLDQIERLLDGMRQVTDNIAHDLRTPLNRMRSRIEVALLGDSDSEALRPVMEQTLHDAEAMIGTFNALLDIARAEAGSERASFEEVDLTNVVSDIVDLYRPLAEDKGQTVETSIAESQKLQANRHLLSQALANLLDNAIKYTPEGGEIRLTVADGPSITVEDDGPGIPTEDHEKVLDRFVRLDDARAAQGNGLGLSLVNAVAKLHGARLVLTDSEPGLCVRLDFRGRRNQNKEEYNHAFTRSTKVAQDHGQEAKA